MDPVDFILVCSNPASPLPRRYSKEPFSSHSDRDILYDVLIGENAVETRALPYTTTLTASPLVISRALL